MSIVLEPPPTPGRTSDLEPPAGDYLEVHLVCLVCYPGAGRGDVAACGARIREGGRHYKRGDISCAVCLDMSARGYKPCGHGSH